MSFQGNYKTDRPAGPFLPYTENRISEENTDNRWRIGSLACIAVVMATALYYMRGGTSMADLLRGMNGGKLFLGAAMVFMALALAEFIWRAVLVFIYRPVKGCADDMLPSCTVVVPAFNEGRQVLLTLRSLAASNYPKDKLQLIAVDDGSVDDTWIWIRKAGATLDRPLVTIRQTRNLGKRHALYSGFQQSTGEVLVTVDSDSTIESDTLRNLVAPFVADKKVGGVAGNVRVLNMDQGILPKMIDIVFVFSFDFIRASQSMVRTVMCTPGALSAYRKKVVMGVLEEWRDQLFCGRPANIGEDRAMTNLILRQGFDVVFQQNARVYTQVPVGYMNLCRMYLRWARSNIRETIAMTRFIFTPFRRGSKLGARINLILAWVVLTKSQLLLVATWALIVCHPAGFGITVLLGVLLFSGLAALIYAWKFGSFSSLWAFAYGIYFFFALAWIRPYALITPHKSGWLTRQIKTGDQGNRMTGKQIQMQEG